jgi:hypothetical protein
MLMGEAISCLWVGGMGKSNPSEVYFGGPHANYGWKCPYINVIYHDSNLNISPKCFSKA